MTATRNGRKYTEDELIANAMMLRSELFRQFCGPRHDLYQECGYPEWLGPYLYRDMYDRNGYAERVVQLMPMECWQQTPIVYEDRDTKKLTKFEKAWDDLNQSFRPNGKSWYQDDIGSLIWSYLLKIDVLSGIGSFGILLLGFDDGKLLQEPMEGIDADGFAFDVSGVSETSKDIYGGDLPPRTTMGTDAQYFGTQFSPMNPKGSKKGQPRLLFMRAFDESLVQVVQYEANPRNPRFGLPIMYLVTLNDPKQPHTGVGLPLATVRVHWSRVIHVADNGDRPSETFAKPRMQPVYNDLHDIRKIGGASAEGYWQAAFPGISLESHPQLGGDVDITAADVQPAMDEYRLGLKRWLLNIGMTAKTLSPSVVDPTPHTLRCVQAICVELKCPMRVFMGSERGEQASTQDDSNWNDRCTGRNSLYTTPRLIVPFIDRLIQVNCLPEPEGYGILWPDRDSTTDKDKAGIALVKTQALVAYVGGNVESVMQPQDFLTRVMGEDEEDAEEILDEAAKGQEKDLQEGQAIADKHGFEPKPPEGFQAPPPPAAPPKSAAPAKAAKAAPPAKPTANEVAAYLRSLE